MYASCRPLVTEKDPHVYVENQKLQAHVHSWLMLSVISHSNLDAWTVIDGTSTSTLDVWKGIFLHRV